VDGGAFDYTRAAVAARKRDPDGGAVAWEADGRFER
jgi:hypothetical protein